MGSGNCGFYSAMKNGQSASVMKSEMKYTSSNKLLLLAAVYNVIGTLDLRSLRYSEGCGPY